jgi:hypothetical protein
MSEVVPYSFVPSNLTEAMEFCKMIASSSFCPPTMKGKPGDIFMCLQTGAEIGLSQMQSLQSIAIINGKPCVWGDGALAVVQASSPYEYHKEWYEGKIEDGDRVAHCLVKRKGNEEVTKSFSMNDAKMARLWSKAGVWQQYPDRMLQMRARAFAIRDQFSDALKGLSVREEVEDYDIKKIKPVEVAVFDDSAAVESIPYTIEEAIKEINNSNNVDFLANVFRKAYPIFKHLPEELKHLMAAKDKRKDELIKQEAEFNVLHETDLDGELPSFKDDVICTHNDVNPLSEIV